LEAPVTVRKCPTSHAASPKLFGASVLISAALFFSPQLALAQFAQQGPKLVGTFVPGDVPVEQGYSVALSIDGNTAIIGGPFSSDTGMYTVGAAWVFTRSGGVWTQQGGRLEGNDILVESRSPVLQGYSVALSADRNTAIVGGPGDANQLIGTGVGASWVYTRSGGVWTQQGPKLVGSDAAGFAAQGWSVALSADGNTAIVGGPDDGSTPFPPGPGATWVYVRSGGVWTQQGAKLVGAGAIGAAQQGTSVAVSADGDTAIVSGPSDNAGAGAVWTFSRSGGVWTQQSDKLVVKANSVALSADGNTAVMGGSGTSSVYIRTGGVWTQQGPALVGTGAVGDSEQGYSVGITGDGNTAIVGGPGDNAGVGAAWLFTRNGVTWTQQGSKLVGTGAVGAASQGSAVALSGNGNTAMMGGTGDASGTGAAWVFVQPALQVSPATDIAASGTQGETFAPSSFQYQLSSTIGSVNYQITGIPTWLNANFTSGTATTSPVTVTFSLINPGRLHPGHHSSTIIFTNTSNGQGNTTRRATLTVHAGDKHRCKDGGWRDFISFPGPFRNQGHCESHFEHER
jgi:hypothetical protein